MLKKFWCWLIGHKRTSSSFLEGRIFHKVCPRCEIKFTYDAFVN